MRIEKRDDAWYWEDDDCEEPMGPFDSRSEMVDDILFCRFYPLRKHLEKLEGNIKRAMMSENFTAEDKQEG